MSESQEVFNDARFERTCAPEGHIFITERTSPGHWAPFFYASGLRPNAPLQVTITSVYSDGRTEFIGRGVAAQYDYANGDGYFGFGQQVSCDIVASLIFTASDGTTTRTTTAHRADAPTCDG